jgi:hypothetical protein
MFLNFRKVLRDVTSKYPYTFQVIQLTFIYFFALVDLSHSILNNVFSLGYFPEILKPLFPIIKSILTSPILKAWSSPEKVFFLSYVVIEFMVVRATFKFSKLVKYNILLIFSMLMVQGLLISYWDLIFSREIDILGSANFMDKNLTIIFYSVLFLFFFGLYFYCYILSLRGLFPIFPGPLQRVVDSVAFWLQVKPSNDPKKN